MRTRQSNMPIKRLHHLLRNKIDTPIGLEAGFRTVPAETRFERNSRRGYPLI
jgi:hypothetical protein